MLLSFASALSPFGMSVIVPVIGLVSVTYGADYATAQFVISAYLFGLGFTQPFAGLLADRVGRRPVMLGGVGLFSLASIGCALATHFWVLVALRTLQAIGISVATVATRAIIRDTHDAEGSVRAISFVAAALGVAPVIAPVVGGLVSAPWGVAGVFYICAVLAGLTWMLLWRQLEETGTPVQGPAGLRRMFKDWWSLLRNGPFVAHTVLLGIVQGSFFAFIAVGSSLFDTQLGIGPQLFGLTWGFLAVSYVFGAVASARLVSRIDVQRIMRPGIYMTMAFSWTLFLVVWIAGVGLVKLLLPLAMLTLANGLVSPLAMAGAVNARPDIAGAAAGLSGAIALVMSGLCAVISGFVYQGDFAPVALIIAVAGSLALPLLPVMYRSQPGAGRAG